MAARARPRPATDRILAAAERMFARRGYGETSLRQLMTAAKVSTTAFYARFDSKEAVLAALVDRLIADLVDAVGPVLAAARSPNQAVEEAPVALLAAVRSRRRLVAIALTEAASTAPVRAALSRAYRGLVALLAPQLRMSAEDGEALAWAYVGALLIQIQRWAVFEEIDEAELAAALEGVATRLLPAVQSRRRG